MRRGYREFKLTFIIISCDPSLEPPCLDGSNERTCLDGSNEGTQHVFKKGDTTCF